MIARVCSGFVIFDRIDEFLQRLRQQVLPAYVSASGILSVAVLQRTLVAYHEVVILSLWESRDAVFEFAGNDPGAEVSIKELGVILKEPVNFELVTIWSSESRNAQENQGDANS